MVVEKAEEKTTLLRVENLSIGTHKTRIVEAVNFDILVGEIFALVGESGSGKTLIALAIIRLLAKNLWMDGAIFYQKKRVSAEKINDFRGRKIAFIFQDPAHSLNPVMTIGKQIDEVLKHHTKLSKPKRYRRVLQLLKLVEMVDENYHRYPHQISGGQKQRVMIAMALAGGAKLIIADEPTTALDATTQKQILDLLHDLQKSEGLAILLITHDLAVVKKMANRIGVIQNGRVVENRQKDAFFAAPKTEYAQKLLSVLAPKKIENNEKKIFFRGENIKIYFAKKGFLWRTVGYFKALDGVDFALCEGRNLAIVGESGSGKTTLALALLRQLSFHSGTAFFHHQNIAEIPPRQYAKTVQIVFQNVASSFNPKLRIGETLLEGLRALVPENAKRSRLEDLARAVELSADLLDRFPHQLSGGQLQRFAIARALSVEPKIIICDEPTSALDVATKKTILDLLLNIQRAKRITYILITHDISIVGYFADELMVMRSGKIVEQGESRKILQTPQNPYTQKLLGAVLA